MTVIAYSPGERYTGESNGKTVAVGVEFAVILSGFLVTSENGSIAEALGNPFITGLI